MALDPALLEQIRNNDPALTKLMLHLKKIDDNSATLLADAMKTNHTVTSLALGYNAISDAGAIALADALRDNHTLTGLYLSFNSIGVAGATALADALKNNHALASLNLEGNSIEDEGNQALADALITSKNILYIKPATNELRAHFKQNEFAVLTLIKKIKNNPNSLTQDDRQEIQERIPAIVHVELANFSRSREQTLEMLSSIGINLALGSATQRVNQAREAQRQAALEDPSQGI